MFVYMYIYIYTHLQNIYLLNYIYSPKRLDKHPKDYTKPQQNNNQSLNILNKALTYKAKPQY